MENNLEQLGVIFCTLMYHFRGFYGQLIKYTLEEGTFGLTLLMPWHATVSKHILSIYYVNPFGVGNIVPEPRAGSNSKARVHPNLKNLRLRPLQVVIVCFRV